MLARKFGADKAVPNFKPPAAYRSGSFLALGWGEMPF